MSKQENSIPEAAVEAAAEAAESCHANWGTWEDVARAALEAAAPHMMTEALASATATLEAIADFVRPENWAHGGPHPIQHVRKLLDGE